MEHAARDAAMLAALGHEARLRIARLLLGAPPGRLLAGGFQPGLRAPAPPLAPPRHARRRAGRTAPPLNLTLNASSTSCLGALNHLGIQVASTEAVEQAKRRVEAAGLATWEERNTDCCYALQDKIWVTDPNGYRWEVFVVKAMTGDTTKPCCAA